MTRLSVNINKIALIRNARGGNLPNLPQIAKDIESFGAQGITVHPRPDERHIRYSDIPILKEVVQTEFNIEGRPNPRFMEMVLANKPDQCTLVPDAPAAVAAPLTKRTDLRHLPLITIDPADARDRDDACYVEQHADGTFTIWVAIADVAHYVTPGSELDQEARKRGNSTYFPDRVVPMLPDTLSGDLCSLHENVDRACIAVAMTIDADGTKTGQTFHRGLMRSIALLAYEDAQAAIDGQITDKTAPLVAPPVLKPLYAAYQALLKARARRQPLELDLPERQIKLTDDGKVEAVNFKDRLDAHKLIEEFMVLANVATAETLIAKQAPQLFRVHEEPNPDKLDALREVVQSSGMTLAKGQVLKTAHLNRLLSQARDTEHAELVNIATLRSMTQAYYNPENFGY